MTKDEAYRFVKNFNDQNKAMLKLEEVLNLLVGSEAEFARIDARRKELAAQEDVARQKLAMVNADLQTAIGRQGIKLAELAASYEARKTELENQIAPAKQAVADINIAIGQKKTELDRLISEKSQQIGLIDKDVMSKQAQLMSINKEIETIKNKFS